jgi:multicomponent K+:H+ antiporter subunit A
MNQLYEGSAQSLLLPMLLVPFLGAVICAMLRPRAAGRFAGWVSAAAVALAVFAIAEFIMAGERPIVYSPGGDGQPMFGLCLDAAGSFMLFLAMLPGFVAIIFSPGHLGPDAGAEKLGGLDFAGPSGCYYSWLLAAIGAMTGVALACNYLMFFVFLLLAATCSWALIGYRRDEASRSAAGVATLVLGIAVGLIAVALVLLRVNVPVNSFAFGAIDEMPAGMGGAVYALFLVAALMIAGQFPFFSWLTKANTAPTPVNAYLHATALVNAGLYLLIRASLANSSEPYWLGVIACGAALITMVLCAVLAMFANDLKQVLALLTSAQLGVVLAAIGCGVMGSEESLAGAMLQMLKIGVGLGLIYLCLGIVMRSAAARRVSELAGLGHRLPLAATGFFVGTFTITGMAPFPGFWGQTLISAHAMEVGPLGATVGVFVVLEGLAVFGYLLWLGQRVFFGSPRDRCILPSDVTGMRVAVVVLALLCLLVPFYSLALIQYVNVGM